MTKERKLQMHLLMMRDVIEMQAIYEAAAAGRPAVTACSEVLNGEFQLSPLVAQGISENTNYLLEELEC